LTALLCQCPAACYVSNKTKGILRHTEISQRSIVHTTSKDIRQVIFTGTQSFYTPHHEYYIHFPTIYKYLEIFCITHIGTPLKHTGVHSMCTQNTHQKVSLQRLSCEVFQLASFKITGLTVHLNM